MPATNFPLYFLYYSVHVQIEQWCSSVNKENVSLCKNRREKRGRDLLTTFFCLVLAPDLLLVTNDEAVTIWSC